ncbi:hypothetical protein O181_018407 [Austropuccinia psidii MF-1]|uniref:Uncharacterized protein n=1 Tax=Austropuccinia psidii MF-1 TaxID=1389203 RepID=A0A9Q3GTH6_9BASI|nr:hypothetical protein [Austropuccinia psidii MF-1]
MIFHDYTMSSDSFCACSNSIDSDSNESMELMKSRSPNTSDVHLKAAMESLMNLSSLYIEQEVPIPPPPLISVPGITFGSIIILLELGLEMNIHITHMTICLIQFQNPQKIKQKAHIQAQTRKKF